MRRPVGLIRRSKAFGHADSARQGAGRRGWLVAPFCCSAGLEFVVRRSQMTDGVRGLMLADKPIPSGFLKGRLTFEPPEHL